ncbi:hypothetical protein NADFUDRAFT_48568 [Nadsonia fulvescens var. elongata DSM 6958]|uniref:G-patch domain-containing protein n=1 Tax=Nadsonia fulvescens var. elongata DSM 6958 TaxID=857566 RepID=A0A1E3PSV5_9ASCO|nr:hypothetical protein NADFUDRAFT_48568 [Nadsonia fulvescens var. elongata DSM 6958]
MGLWKPPPVSEWNKANETELCSKSNNSSKLTEESTSSSDEELNAKVGVPGRNIRIDQNRAASNDSGDEEDYMNMSFSGNNHYSATNDIFKNSISNPKSRIVMDSGRKRARMTDTSNLEYAMNQSLLECEDAKSSVGLKLMESMGWKIGEALGKRATSRVGDDDAELAESPRAILEPIVVSLRTSKAGIGSKLLAKPQSKKNFESETVQFEQVVSQYRKRVLAEHEEKRLETTLKRMQRVGIELEEKDLEKTGVYIPQPNLKDLVPDTGLRFDHDDFTLQRYYSQFNVLWRGLIIDGCKNSLVNVIKKQALSDFAKNHCFPLSEANGISQLAKYKDHETTSSNIEGSTENLSILECSKDMNLENFEALPLNEKLAMVYMGLRRRFFYCFWCGCSYKNVQEMQEFCPGVTEAVHDS